MISEHIFSGVPEPAGEKRPQDAGTPQWQQNSKQLSWSVSCLTSTWDTLLSLGVSCRDGISQMPSLFHTPIPLLTFEFRRTLSYSAGQKEMGNKMVMLVNNQSTPRCQHHILFVQNANIIFLMGSQLTASGSACSCILHGLYLRGLSLPSRSE
jgi:hypothetical protein